MENYMTWGEFKALIDAADGVTEDTPIRLIEVFEPVAEFLLIEVTDKGLQVERL